MVIQREILIETTNYIELIPITHIIEEIVESCEIKNGIIAIITMHTTTGITMNENLECLLDDMKALLSNIVPEHGKYAHSRMLHSYGTTAGNPTGHLKAMLTGNHVLLPIVKGRLMRGSAQDIFLCEFDGAQSRHISITIAGE